jgi:hypothetical protein
MALWAACGAAAPVAHWSFEEGSAGASAAEVSEAGTVASSVNSAACAGAAGVYGGKGTVPVYDPDVPAAEVWDGATLARAANARALRFRLEGVAGAGAPVGGQVTVPGGDPLLQPPGLTVEAFVKVEGLTGRHALLASKRRRGESGATWSLALTPEGKPTVRFDTDSEAGGRRTGQFNQCVNAGESVADGGWHHVAVSYDPDTREARLYADHRLAAKGTVAAPLVYDGSDLVLGRGLNGWLDEVRITPEALHPEQFLRPARFFSDLRPEKRAAGPALLDQTFTRVQSALEPGLERIGTLIPKGVQEIGTSMWSLGCETLDRDLADWDAYKGYLEPLGIRRVRLQGGWNRTEKKKGEYDFAWLDAIVDDALARGLEVCLETSYNNRLYEPGGATGPGGLLPEGGETLAAWDRWVEAMARRYSAKGVKEWMMYNEPNLRKENTAEKIVANNIRTAEIIKRVDPEARIGAFVLSGMNVELMRTMLEQLRAQGRLGLFRWAVYHGYSGNPDRLNARMEAFNAVLAEVAPGIRPWQGEAGCASEEVQYALSGIPWTEYSHAKWNARRMLCDIGHGIDSSVFTISDLTYHRDFISRYGLLKTAPDNSVLKVKTAYYTVQNVVSVFNDALERVPGYALAVTAGETNLTWFAFRDKASGLDAVALWDGREIPSNDSAVSRVELTVKGGRFREPVWIDLVTGNVYAIPAERVAAEGDTVRIAGVPVYDGPGAVADRSLLTYEKARPKKGTRSAAAAGGGGKPGAAAGRGGTPGGAAGTGAPKMAVHLLPGTQQPAPAVLVAGAAEGEAAKLSGWLNGQDVHAFVLAPEASGREAADALRAIRGRAAEWQVKLDAVGVMASGPAGRAAALAAAASADFAVLLDADSAAVRSVPEPKRGDIFVGKKDGWEKPLAAWLEKRKGRVF